MKKMKKILAFVLAMAMVLGMTLTAFADEEKGNQHAATGTNMDTGKITVEGITPEDGVTVTAYQIIKAKYENNGSSFVGYESLYPGQLSIDVVDDDESSTTNGKSVEITETQLNAVITKMAFLNGVPTDVAVGAASKVLTIDENGKYVAGDLPVGSYLVVVSGADTKIYSPIVVSIFYVDASQTGNTVEEGSVNVQDGNAWVKVSSEPGIDKIATPEHELVIADADADSVNIGDTINYQVVINPVPYYGGINPVFKLTDTLSEGLELQGGVAGVKVSEATINEDNTVTAGDELDNEEYAYEITVVGRVITVDFAPEKKYVLNELQGKALVVEYSAKVTNAAKLNGDGNSNEATLKYSKDSNIEGSDEEKTVKTYNYTFDLSVKEEGITETITNMLTKVGVEIGGTTSTTAPLAGAEFKLYTDGECENPYTNEKMEDVISSEVNTGSLVVQGLSAGTYYMKETKAPNGYSLNDHVFKIEIDAEYYDDFTVDGDVPVTHKNKLSGYTIKVDGTTIITGTGSESNKMAEITVNKGTVYQETIVDKNGEVIDNPDFETSTFEIKNTHLSQLPSTGGIGTTIFTIGGCAIMIIAAALFFVNRRKSAK